MLKSYLDFEQPIADLEQQVVDLQDSELDDISLQKEVVRLNESIMKTTEKIYSNLSPWQNVQVARHPERPHFIDYIERITDSFDELHGDRHFSDDRARPYVCPENHLREDSGCISTRWCGELGRWACKEIASRNCIRNTNWCASLDHHWSRASSRSDPEFSEAGAHRRFRELTRQNRE